MARGEPTKTIGNARAGGEKALTLHCLGPECHYQAVKTFEELKLWNDMSFIDVPQHRPRNAGTRPFAGASAVRGQYDTINPGIIFTPLAEDELTGQWGEGYRRMIEVSAAGRGGTPDEVGTVGALVGVSVRSAAIAGFPTMRLASRSSWHRTMS